MKKLLFVILLFCGYAHAQTVEFGAKAGANFASISGDDTADFEGKIDYHFGLIAEVTFGGKFAFLPEVIYSFQGAKSEMSESYFGFRGSYSYSNKEELKLDYINIPLLAKYNIIPGLSVQAGPQIGFLVKSEVEYEMTVNGQTESETVDVKDSMKGIDFALAAGLGYKLDTGLFFNARYNVGLSNIVDNEEGVDSSGHNNVLQLSVGYMF